MATLFSTLLPQNSFGTYFKVAVLPLQDRNGNRESLFQGVYNNFSWRKVFSNTVFCYAAPIHSPTAGFDRRR